MIYQRRPKTDFLRHRVQAACVAALEAGITPDVRWLIASFPGERSDILKVYRSQAVQDWHRTTPRKWRGDAVEDEPCERERGEIADRIEAVRKERIEEEDRLAELHLATPRVRTYRVTLGK